MLERRTRLIAYTAFLLALAGCPAPAPKEIAPTREGLDAYARRLYDLAEASDQGQADALDAELRRTFHFLGVPVVDSRQLPADELTQRLESPHPPAVDFELQLLAQGLRSGVVVSLESLLLELGDQGFKTRDPSASLTPEHLIEKLSPLVEKGDYTQAERPLALILALGRERARRSGVPPTNAVFGDDVLDPLQLTLFMRQVLPIYAAARAGTTQGKLQSQRSAAVLQEIVLEKVIESVPGLADAFAKGGVNLVKMAVMLYGSKLYLSATPTKLWHQRPGADSVSTLTATVEYTWYPYDLGIMNYLQSLGITLPDKGPLPGKTINWAYDKDTLGQHGELTSFAPRTDAKGQASAQFTVTTFEDTPEEGWIADNIKTAATGFVRIQSHGLVQELEKLEAEFRFITDGGLKGKTHNEVQLEILEYHRLPLLSGTITITEEQDLDSYTRYDAPDDSLHTETSSMVKKRFTQHLTLEDVAINNSHVTVSSSAEFSSLVEGNGHSWGVENCLDEPPGPFTRYTEQGYSISGSSTEPVEVDIAPIDGDVEKPDAVEFLSMGFETSHVWASGMGKAREYGNRPCKSGGPFDTSFEFPVMEDWSNYSVALIIPRYPVSPVTFQGSTALALPTLPPGLRWTRTATWDLSLRP
ncbi:hypothetical protein JRI60_25090 [Archangium violaceum]|uniref:Ig-like domain-containing protein n=1 Tax=Archangium violaceum TaxID=83451 RepID=UPI001951BFF6|nr:Ig-like domain-containing protein [Archangium violaceum]QRO02051.1 hypothetical protein JRI60_25090 [Archangium violaceum]